MWNQLRDKDEAAPFFEDDTPDVVEAEHPSKKIKMPSVNLGRYFEEPILGMTAPQRFLLSTMVLIAVCLLGTMFLVITGTFSLF
jgi:hypothetical protein